MADALANKMLLSPNKSVPTLEMQSPDKNDDTRLADRGNSLIPRMGTRKNNIQFGKNVPNYIRNQSEMSHENENSINRQ